MKTDFTKTKSVINVRERSVAYYRTSLASLGSHFLDIRGSVEPLTEGQVDSWLQNHIHVRIRNPACDQIGQFNGQVWSLIMEAFNGN